MTSFYQLLKTVGLIDSYIERALGGEVTYSDDEKENGIILKWKKFNPTTNKMLRFSYKISYDEIESITEPFAYAEHIINKYKEKEKNG